jgi:hypothetical protein
MPPPLVPERGRVMMEFSTAVTPPETYRLPPIELVEEALAKKKKKKKRMMIKEKRVLNKDRPGLSEVRNSDSSQTH